MLLRNTLRGLWRKKMQFLGITALISLSVLLFIAFGMASHTMEETFAAYREEQNMQDFLFYPQVILGDAEKEELLVSYQIPPEAIATLSFSELVKTYGIDLHPYEVRAADELAAKYDFTYEYRQEKNIEENGYFIKGIIPGDGIDIPYLLEGHLPIGAGEITLSDSFASYNGISIGDSYTYGGKNYQVTGLAYPPDFIFPVLSITSPLYNYKAQSTAYMLPEDLEAVNGESIAYFVGKFHGSTHAELQEMMREDEALGNIQFNEDNQRISTISAQIEGQTAFVTAFVGLLLVIALIIIVMVVRKRIVQEKKQIGVLKAMGYSSLPITMSYLVYPLLAGISGSVLGIILGTLIYPELLKLYRNYYYIPAEAGSLYGPYLWISLLGPLVLLLIVTFISCFQITRKKPLTLLSEGSDNKVSKFSKLVNRLLNPLSFKRRFKYSLAARSLGKLLAVSISIIGIGIVITFVFVASKMFDKAIEDTFQGSNYNYEVYYSQKVTRDIVAVNEGEEVHTRVNLAPEKVLHRGGERLLEDASNEMRKTRTYGIDPQGKMLVLRNKEGDSLNDLLDKGIVINEMYQMVHQVEVGDILVVKVSVAGEEKVEEIPVVGINESYNGPIVYYSLDKVNALLGYSEGEFNGKYVLEQPEAGERDYVSSIFSVEDLRQNMASFLSISRSMMNVMIVVALLIAAIILITICNLIIDENKKSISLLKVLGYQVREVSSMVLNIYTPVVIVMYFISVVLGRIILEEIMIFLSKKMSIGFPVAIGWSEIVAGLFVLLITYYGCLLIARRGLRKISLSEVLKQE